MAPADRTPPPIDRPLSKAYLRQFVGWSTAFPPGQSEPNSLRLMENVWIDRNGAAVVRPGLRHLTYTAAAGLDPVAHGSPGTAMGLPVIGAPELFYLDDGSPAWLFAVREADGRVGFRAALTTTRDKVVHRLDDPLIGFSLPQGESVLNFDEGTTHVKYLQINNRILALSDNGESARIFYVGGQKLAKKLKGVFVPEWTDDHKPTVIHPDASWINAQTRTTRSNLCLNPSFEIGTRYWTRSPRCAWRTVVEAGQQGGKVLEVYSLPARTNMEPDPLFDAGAHGYSGWSPGPGDPALTASGAYLVVTPTRPDTDHLAVGPRILENVVSERKYRVALDFMATSPVGSAQPIAVLESFSSDGLLLGSHTLDITGGSGRWVSPALSAATGAVTLRLSLGGRGRPWEAGTVPVQFSGVVVCADGEPTDMFHGGSGTDYYWTGTPWRSASVHHPPVDIWVRSSPHDTLTTTNAMVAVAAVRKMQEAATTVAVAVLLYGSTMESPAVGESTFPLTTSWARYGRHGATAWSTVSSALRVTLLAAPRGARFQIDGAMLEEAGSVASPYFDGSTPSTTLVRHTWQGVFSNLPHEGPSQQAVYPTQPALQPETPTTKTLIASGGASANTYKMGFFYTFENDIGESAPSRITEVRLSRPWSNWVWELPNAAGEPSGTYTPDAALAADQLVVTIPELAYSRAVRENALRWNLYAMAWSDQQPVPVVAQQVASKDIYPDQATSGSVPLEWDIGGFIQLTASRRAGTDDTVLPTQLNRVNSSIPPQHRNGVVAGDRMVLVGSPTQPGTISWSSSSPGRYTLFTPNKGGGQKTLTSGNLNLPYSVVLWQNPQSVDTLTILCAGDYGRSTSHYMSPASVTAGNTGAASIMGFEETTSTPGTVSPFGAEVLNNALYRPLGNALMKSTASNYNINHKTQTDKIANMWQMLDSKKDIISAQMDNRLYYLVHNPTGENLLPGCMGNEVWVFDVAAENGHWSRFLIQGSALRPIVVGSETYMSVSRPDGIYYLDENTLLDDYVDLDGLVRTRPIGWLFETNTQGANRAHDAWAHLQQVGIVAGNFQGSMIYGVRGQTVNGKKLNISKVFHDHDDPAPRGQRWDVEDFLLVRRDLKEWYFFASSQDGRQGVGQIGVVQYRYTPVSVNVGYEFGSIETFEYGDNANSDGSSSYARNGIPRPYIDYSRP